MVRISYKEVLPCPALRPYIARFWAMTSDGPLLSPSPRQSIPDGHTDIIFSFSDPIIIRTEGIKQIKSSSRVYITGTPTRPVFLQTAGWIDILGIRFHPGAAYPILKIPMSEFTDQLVGLDLVWGKAARMFWERMANANSLALRVVILEKELLSRISEMDSRIQTALHAIINAGGENKMDKLDSLAGISSRQLERNFAAWVGVSPKLFARIVRFRKALRSAEAIKEIDWTTIAMDCGYYDQAHLIKDFNDFVGSSPISFFEQQTRMSDFSNTSKRPPGIIYSVQQTGSMSRTKEKNNGMDEMRTRSAGGGNRGIADGLAVHGNSVAR